MRHTVNLGFEKVVKWNSSISYSTTGQDKCNSPLHQSFGEMLCHKDVSDARRRNSFESQSVHDSDA